MSEVTITFPETVNPEATENQPVFDLSKGLTPTQYFEEVKNFKNTITEDALANAAENIMTLLRKSMITGQKSQAEILIKKLNLINREIKAVKAGFDVYVLKTDIELYISKVEDRVVKVIELKNYEREIPDEIIDVIVKAKEYFDELFVVFTDYTKKETKKVEKKKRDKDPILFGAYSKDSGAPEERMYYIADWVDPKCDLTIDDMCKTFEAETGKGMLHLVDRDYTDTIEEFKEKLKAMDEKTEKQEESGIKIGDDRVSHLSTLIKVLEKITPKKKRGRKKKTEDVISE